MKALISLCNAQADMGLRCPHMPEDMFSHGAVHMWSTKPRVDVAVSNRPLVLWFYVRVIEIYAQVAKATVANVKDLGFRYLASDKR